MASTIYLDGMTISFDQPVEVVSTSGHNIADPEWQHTDKSGHTHRFDGEDLPSLKRVVTGTYWCETCWDEHDISELHCRICGDVVEPHYAWSGEQTELIPGLMSITATTDDGRTYVLRGNELDELRRTVVKTEADYAAAVRAIVERREPDRVELRFGVFK